MELFVALLTFLGVAFTSTSDKTSIGIQSGDVTKIQNSDQYKEYLKGGGVDVFDFSGRPAILVEIIKDDQDK